VNTDEKKGGRGGKRPGADRKRVARDEEVKPKGRHGGSRPGAGRPIGSRTSPSPSQMTLAIEEPRDGVANHDGDGSTPK